MDEYEVTIIKHVLIESCKSGESTIENDTKFNFLSGQVGVHTT